MANNNKHTGPNVPALRFPEFSGEWKRYRVSDLLEFYPTNSLSWDQLEYDGNECLNLHYGLIHNGLPVQVDLSKDSLPSIKADFFPKKYTLCQDGDIAFADASEDTNDVGKAIEFYNCAGKEAVCGLHTIHGRDKLGITVPGFKGYVFSSRVFHNQIKTIAQGTKVFSIKASNFDEVVLSIPSKEEQTKISKLLMAIDERISAQSKIIEEQETLLKSLRDILLKQSSSSSDHCRIGDILSIGNGKDYQHLNEGDIPVYGTGGLMCHVNESLYDGESVCIGRKGTINKPIFLKGRFWTVDTLFYTHSYKGVLPRFCYHLFCTIDWLTYNEASGVPSLSKSTIEKIPVLIPTIEMQGKIVQILDTIEEKVDTDRKTLQNYKNQKAYLLSRMFI